MLMCLLYYSCGCCYCLWMLCFLLIDFFFFFKQKTAYEMRISDWSSDVCSSDLLAALEGAFELRKLPRVVGALGLDRIVDGDHLGGVVLGCRHFEHVGQVVLALRVVAGQALQPALERHRVGGKDAGVRSEEHTSELQSLMRISYAVFCLKKKNNNNHT